MPRLRRSDTSGPGYHRRGKRLVDEDGAAAPAEVKERVADLVIRWFRPSGIEYLWRVDS